MRRSGEPPSDDFIAALWRRYRADRDMEARARLLEQYLGLVHHAARELIGRIPAALDLEDLVGAGTYGLVQALEGFDPDRGVAFSSFALPRIRGAVLDEIRSWDWVPRSARDRARRVRATRDRLRHEMGREPAHADVARALDLDMETYWRHARDTEARVILPLDAAAEGDSRTAALAESMADPASTSEPLETKETLDRLGEGFARLCERDRIVLSLSFLEGLTLRQIGEVLHVTESRVSQIRARALKRLLAEVEPEVRAA